MNSQDSNTSTAVKYFKNNYIKMIVFILISLILTGSLTYKYSKEKALYYSMMKIRVNEAIKWNVKNVNNAIYDVLYFLENRNVKNIRVFRGQNESDHLTIEIAHKSVDDKNSESLKELFRHMEDYKEELEGRLIQYTDWHVTRLNGLIAQATNEIVIKSYNLEIVDLLVQKDSFLDHLNKEKVYKIDYDKEIKNKNAKKRMVKNLVITLMISIILIIFSLWVKLFIREIKKNS